MRKAKKSGKPVLQDSQTDWQRVKSMTDEEIDLSDIPELTAEQIATAAMRIGGKPVPAGQVPIIILVDADVVAHYKRKAGNRDYRPLLNQALWAAMQRDH